MIKLEPCAHCGGYAELYDWCDESYGSYERGEFRCMDEEDVREAIESNESKPYLLTCTTCPATMNYECTVIEIINAWNKRVQ